MIIYTTFFPQALQPGFALCMRSIIGECNEIFLFLDTIWLGCLDEFKLLPKLLYCCELLNTILKRFIIFILMLHGRYIQMYIYLK